MAWYLAIILLAEYASLPCLCDLVKIAYQRHCGLALGCGYQAFEQLFGTS